MRVILQIVFVVIALAGIHFAEASSSSNRQKRCRRLPFLANGNVLQNGRTNIRYECNLGYKLKVSGVCRRRSWLPNVICEEIQCKADPVIPNGSLDSSITSRKFDAKYTFTCNAGFKGMGKVKCNKLGIWEVNGNCEKILDLCKDDPVIQNGTLDTNITSRELGAEYTFTCNAGFKGMGNVKCNSLGIFEVNGNCEDCFLVSKILLVTEEKAATLSGVTEDECTDQQYIDRNFTDCGTAFVLNDCTVFLLPLIDIYLADTLAECKQLCIAAASCLLFSYAPESVLCLLFDSLSDESFTFQDFPNASTQERDCQV
ncbi:hypothetical protein LOTGIDRAFT_173712 [Lottia gigantea]|uniref:Sushi domain-containing protein n=1 Tax=Lottia gigantea TaxID=225164 RepID=V4AWY7_LOTGI|nr:hypothetical protein LOTGIDRAFT_173712 [Lottia gigantea]ESO99570.1 hypothetical protein LOTGIDRAFT_173712 [Lottia gigantea]